MTNLADKSRPFGEIGDPDEWKPPKEPVSVDGFEESSLGIFLPTDSHRQVRTIYFFQGMAVQVLETQEQICKLIDAARAMGADAHWIKLHEVQLGEPVSVPMSALDKLCWIGESWVDVTASKEQQRQIEMARKAQRTGLQVVQGQPVPRSNGRRR